MTFHPRLRPLAAALAGFLLAGMAVHSLTATASEPPALRTVSVIVVTDSAFRKLSSWRGVVKSVVDLATEDFAEEAGLAFRVAEEISWEPPRGLESLAETLDAAVAAVGPRDGVIAVFLGRGPGRRVDPGAKAYSYLARPALVVVPPDPDPVQFGLAYRRHVAMLVRHELGHVFGVPHLEGANVMNPTPSERKVGFGDLGMDVIRASRAMDFTARSPFAGCDLETLRDVYLVLAERGEMETSLLVNLGVAFHRERKFEDARTLFQAALRREGDSLAGRLGLAQAVMATGDTAAGREMTRALAGTEGLTPEMRGVLGALWLELGEYEAAERFLTEAVESGPRRFGFSFNRGLARFHQGRLAGAKHDFEQALDIEERAEAWFNLGLVCDALDEREEAAAAFERYLELVPEGTKSAEARKFIERQKR